MRSRWLRLLPLFFAAIWLPLQAVAAATMPFCRHGEAERLAMIQAVVGEAAVEHCHQQQPSPPADHGLHCDDCGLCHLASAGFMPIAEALTVVSTTGPDYRFWPELAPDSAIPEPPQHPPKRTT